MVRRPFTVVGLCFLLALPVHAQVLPGGHEKHHPKEKAGPEGPWEFKDEVMAGMGGKPAKELFPSLMDIPDLSRENRAEIEKQAQGRMIAGLSMMSEALDRLAQATERSDYPAMQVAAAAMREGFALYESGLAAQRALAEGKSPPKAALNWFKREMNLDTQPSTAPSSGPFGLSWFHFFVMLVLIGFAGVMVWMYFRKMRRASELLKQLTARSPPVPTEGTSSAPGAAPSAPTGRG